MSDQAEVAGEKRELKVIGAGFGRTGTLSLKAALEELGFGPCYHMVELFNKPEDIVLWETAVRGAAINWHELFDGYQAAVDWPECAFYEELMNIYPDARVVLTTRDPESWYESVNSTIYQVSRRAKRNPLASLFFYLMMGLVPARGRVVRIINRLVWQGTFNGRFEDKQYALAIFNQHIENVKKRVPPDKLLVYNVKEGWEPLCRFLDVEVPAGKPFPHLNDRANFAGTRIRQQQQKRLVRVVGVTGAVLAVLLVLLYLSKRAG